MDIDKARQAVAVQDKIDCCTGHLAKLADADSVKVMGKNDSGEAVVIADQPMILRRLVISTPDGGSERTLAVDFDPGETKTVLAAVSKIIQARVEKHVAELDGL